MTIYTETTYTDTTAPTVKLLTAWRHDPAWHGDQLVHAAAPGAHVAECGVEVSFFGRPWPAPGTSTLQSRCSICAQAVQGQAARAFASTPSSGRPEPLRDRPAG